jgi:cation transport regulator
MPYHTNDDLPDSIKKHLPKHAQDIFREAFNHAYAEYSDIEKRRDQEESLETICFKVAWNGVKTKYEKHNDGNWHLRSE